MQRRLQLMIPDWTTWLPLWVTCAFLVGALIIGLSNPQVTHAQRIPPGTGAGINITSAKTTAVKGVSGVLLRIVVQTQVGGATIKLYDIANAGCTGTPASGLLGTITLPATITSANPFALEYDTAFTAGICVVTSGNTDLLVVYE